MRRYSSACGGCGWAQSSRASGTRRPASQHSRPCSITSRVSSAKRRASSALASWGLIANAPAAMRLLMTTLAMPLATRSAALMSSKNSSKPRSACRKAAPSVGWPASAWHSMAKLPTFMRRASRPKNSSSNCCATASQSRANAAAGTRASACSKHLGAMSASASAASRCALFKARTALRTKAIDTVGAAGWLVGTAAGTAAGKTGVAIG